MYSSRVSGVCILDLYIRVSGVCILGLRIQPGIDLDMTV